MEGGPTREFPGDRAFVIGRSQNADFSIPHPNLSREHVRISLKNGEVWLEDLGSANGTFVQGQRLPAKSTVKIKPHYRVLLGTGSDVMLSFEVVEYEAVTAGIKPKGDVDLGAPSPSEDPRRMPSIGTYSEESKMNDSRSVVRETPFREATRTSMTRARSPKMELDFPQNHFPHEVKKEKHAELRIIEAKKQRVLEDIQYKEREVNDLRSKIRDLKDETNRLKDELANFQKEVQPLTDRKAELQHRIEELEVIYEEKIDTLESGFKDLKEMLEDSHASRMASSEREYKEKIRRLEEDYAKQLQQLDQETRQVRHDGEKLRDTLTEAKRQYEENLKKVTSEAEKLEAEHRLTQVRIETEIAQLQGAKMKLENELETSRREKDRVQAETEASLELGKTERARAEEARRDLEKARAEEEAVRRSIEETKQSEEKNVRRIEELKSQISILEAKAGGIELSLKQAEIDADAIRREGQKAADQYRVSVQEQIEAERQAMRTNVEAEMQSRLRVAEGQAANIVAQAETRAAEIQEAARSVAERVTVEANAQIERLTADAKAESERVIAEANGLMERATEAANAEAERLTRDARMNAERLAAESSAAAERVTAEANAYSERVTSEATARAEKTLADANAQMFASRKTFETEMTEARKRADHEVRQMRANAISDIESTRERETKEFESRLKNRVKEIADQVERIVGSKLIGQFGVTMDPVTLKEFSDDIHQVVGRVIGTTKSSANSEITMKTVLSPNTQAQARAVRYWKKVGIAAGVAFVLLMGKLFAPGVYTKLGNKIAGVVEVKDNTDLVVKRMLRERQLAMTFVTDQDREFRDNYTDNLLYVEGFIDMKDDVETNKTWTLGLNKFFQGALGLTEKAIVQFGSAEGRMMRELIDLRKNIIPANSDAGIAKMREVEAGFIKEMKFIVRTDSNWKQFESFHRDFYQRYIQSLGRAPASNAGP